MAPFIFGDRNGIHIMDLSKTVPMLHQALVAVKDVVASGGRILFVGTNASQRADCPPCRSMRAIFHEFAGSVAR